MENSQNYPPATPERVWAGFHELRQLMKENELKAEKSRKEAEKERNDLRLESEKLRIAAEKRMKNLEKLMGSWANNQGSFAEEYFFNSFENNQQNFFGEHFNKIRKNLKMSWKKVEDEYDIVMYNNSSVAIVEVKSKAHEKDVPMLMNKANTFIILCPDYSEYNIYLGLASLSFYDKLEQECIKQGIAIIKQVSETVIINDKHLKVY